MITSFFKPKRTRASTAGKENGANAKGKTDGQNKKQKTTTNNNHGVDDDATENSKPKPNNANSSTPEASMLISYLSDPSNSSRNDDNTADSVPTWKSALGKHFSSPSFKRLAAFVDTERYVTLRHVASIVCSEAYCAALYCILQ
jgi:hypothetical protein